MGMAGRQFKSKLADDVGVDMFDHRDLNSGIVRKVSYTGTSQRLSS